MTGNIDWNQFEELLQPITKEHPTGEDIRYDVVYDQIREARRQDDDYLPQGVWKRDLKMAEWDKVEKLCSDTLKTRSKDLQIAAWLTESWFQQKGVKGLGLGISFMHKMCETYWDTLYPLLTDEDQEHRIAPIDWLNQKLTETVGLYPITFPKESEKKTYTFAEYEFLQKDKYDKRTVAQRPELTLEALKESIKRTENYMYEVLYKDCLDTIDALESFENYLSPLLPKNRVSLYQLRTSLGRYRDFGLTILNERGLLKPKNLKKQEELIKVAPPKQESVPMKTKAGSSEENTNFQSSLPLKSREQAYALLADIATYLQAIEPHSPTPYLLKKAITWGNMPLSQLLQEFIENNMDFAQLQRWLGIPNSNHPGAKRDVASNQ